MRGARAGGDRADAAAGSRRAGTAVRQVLQGLQGERVVVQGGSRVVRRLVFCKVF